MSCKISRLMSFLSTEEKQKFADCHIHAKSLILELKKKNKINPNHASDMTNLHEILNYNNKLANSIIKFDWIVRDEIKLREFLDFTKKYELDKETIDDFWLNLIVLSILKYYWMLESSLIILLKGVKYGTKSREKIKERETLGDFRKTIFPALGLNGHIDWQMIDTNFRNALAHGWYKKDNDHLVYYKNTKLEEPKILTKIELIKKSMGVYLQTITLVAEIGNWKDLNDLGEDDPLQIE